jgi:hypothetical protein
MNKVIKNIPLFLISLTGLIILFSYIKHPIKNPQAWWWNDGSDPLKEYFLPAYYMKYDTGVMCRGFNYPYGEHAVYADIEPSITFPLNWIDNHLFNVHGKFDILFLIFLFGSVVVGAMFLYQILKRFDVPPIWAAAGSILIIWLSPQWERVPSHYGLGYLWIVPAAWYCLIRAESSKFSLKWIGLLSGTILFAGLLHMYNTLIIGVFVGAYSLIGFLNHRKEWKKWGAYLLAVIVPIVSVQLFLKFTDPYSADRPVIPWGFFIYVSEPEGIFLPNFGPLKDFLRNYFNFADTQMEGWGYIGMVGTFACLFLILRMVKKGIYPALRSRIFQITNNSILNRSVGASILVLLFAMGVPFVWGMEFILDWISPLKQFRSLGRFAWVFYYILTVYTIRYCYLVFRTINIKKLKTLAISLMCGFAVFWAIEGHSNLRNRADTYKRACRANGEAEIDYTSLLKQHGTNIYDFQSILFFPYSHTGSEKLGIHRSDISLQQAVYCSYKTGIPIISTFTSRTSLSQSLKLIQLLSHPALEKDVLNDLPNQKPILLICTEEPKQPEEQRVINRSKLICTFGRYTYYHVPLTAFYSEKDSLKAFFEKEIAMISDKSQVVFRGKSTNAIVTAAYAGNTNTFSEEDGIKSTKVKKYHEVALFDGKIPYDSAFINKPFELGTWVKCDHEYPFLPLVHIERYNANNELVEHLELASFRDPMDVYKNWVLNKNEFVHTDKDMRYKIYLRFDYPFQVANLLIKPKEVELFYQKGDLFYNFYPLK